MKKYSAAEVKKIRKELEEKREKLYQPIRKELEEISDKLIDLQNKCPHPYEYVRIVGEYTLDYKECSLCGKYSTHDDWS